MTYQCNNGYRPSSVSTSVCAATAEWTPAPNELNCILETGEIKAIIILIGLLIFYLLYLTSIGYSSTSRTEYSQN